MTTMIRVYIPQCLLFFNTARYNQLAVAAVAVARARLLLGAMRAAMKGLGENKNEALFLFAFWCPLASF